MDQVSFEEAFTQLEKAIAALRDGQMPLEQALEQYQTGVKLVQYCSDLLQKAELTVQQLNVAADGSFALDALDV